LEDSPFFIKEKGVLYDIEKKEDPFLNFGSRNHKNKLEIINDFCAITASTNLTFYRTHLAVSTFLSTNPWFTGKVVILSLESDPISAENIKSIKLLHDDIEEHQIKEIDVKPISSKIAKKGWTRESLLEFLFLYAFKIESRGNFYFSNRVFFNRDISDLLSETGISSPVVANQFPSEPDLKLPIDPDLMFIAETEISDEKFNEMYQSLLAFNLFDPDSRSNSIIKISRHLNIKINRFSNRYLMRTSSYPDSKYTEFIRYHKGIHAIKLNSEESNSHKRIHTYWSHLKNKHSQVKITDPAKISKESEKKEIQTHDYYLNVDNLKLKRNFGKNLSGLDIALYTICDDKFIDGARVMIYSFIRHNPWFNGKIVVLCNQTYSQISLENRSRLLEIYQDIEFKEVDTSIYLDLIENFKKVATQSQLRLVPSLFTFEIFNSCKDHDFLIYIDSDMLILDDISEVFSTDHSILAAPDAGEFRIGSNYYTFNGGFLVLKKEVHEMNYRQALIDHAGSMKSMSLADQTIMNSFFKDEIVLLNSNYNCLKRCFPDNKFNQFKDSIKIVHYVGSKPWDPVKSEFESKYQRIEELWKRELNLLNLSLIKSKSDNKIAVMCHIYYIDIWPEIKNNLNQLGFEFDLYVSLCIDNPSIELEILRDYPSAQISKVENRGSDFGGFFESLNLIFNNNLKYDWILKIHSKKSKLINERKGESWRKNLYTKLIIDAKSKIINNFSNDEIGMIGDKRYLIGMSSFDNKAGKNVNAEKINILRRRFNVNDSTLKFFAGSMFWMRFDLLEQVFKENRITSNDFELGHLPDGTMAHAMERFIANIVRDANKKILGI
jgi:lipopolysaccharide biosynthesis glycosyltransferase